MGLPPGLRFILRNTFECLVIVLIFDFYGIAYFTKRWAKVGSTYGLALIMKNREGAVGLAHALTEATNYLHCECTISIH